MHIRSLGLALGVLATTAAAPAFARDVTAFNSADFDKLSVSDLGADIKYTQNIEKWAGWSAKYGEASKLLALYPGYKEATLWSNKNGVVSSKAEPLVFFFTRTKTVLNTAANAINLKQVIQYSNIKALVPEMRFAPAPITQDQLVAKSLRDKQPITSFAWCNSQQDGQFVNRQHREINLDESLPPASAREPWCSRPDRSTCFEACLPIIDGSLKLAFDTFSKMLGGSDKKDAAQGLQAELRFLLSEAEGGFPKGSFDTLTKVGTPVSGLIELNVFYMNQVVQYGKLVTVLQPDPRDANKTIMSTFLVMAVKSHSWNNENSMVADQIRALLKGNSIFVKAEKGLLAGVPKFSQDLTQNLSKILESGSGS